MFQVKALSSRACGFDVDAHLSLPGELLSAFGLFTGLIDQPANEERWLEGAAAKRKGSHIGSHRHPQDRRNNCIHNDEVDMHWQLKESTRRASRAQNAWTVTCMYRPGKCRGEGNKAKYTTLRYN